MTRDGAGTASITEIGRGVVGDSDILVGSCLIVKQSVKTDISSWTQLILLVEKSSRLRSVPSFSYI